MFHSISRTHWLLPFLFIGLLGICQFFMFFYDLGHFFQGDTIYWLHYRPTSLHDFLRGFVSLDQSGWYRPLGNRLIPFAFFPLFGMAPSGYRLVLFLLLVANTAAVFFVTKELIGSDLAACGAALFFGTHTVNATPAYDAAFAAELLYGLFYTSSAIAYVRYRKAEKRIFLILSIAGFAASLWSKESALTLPITLIAIAIITEPSKQGIRMAFTTTKWHLVVLALFLGLGVGYLGIGHFAFGSLWRGLPANAKGDYHLILDRTIWQNAGSGMTWVFNIPTDPIHGNSVPTWTAVFLRALRWLLCGLGVASLCSSHRRWLFIGVAWFLIASAPALPLFRHFFPYYLFLPLVGFSMAVGTVLHWLYGRLQRFGSLPAMAVCFTPLAVLAFVSALHVRADVPENRLLGGSSRRAFTSVTDIEDLVSRLPRGSIVYIIDDDEPEISWDQASGGLFQLYYDREDLEFRYSSTGSRIPPGDLESIAVLKWDGQHLHNITGEFHMDSSRFAKYMLEYVDGPYTLYVVPEDVVAGRDSYVLGIRGLIDTDVHIYYSLNDRPVKVFTVHLDSNGEIDIPVPSSTEKGGYHLVGFNVRGEANVVRTDTTIKVR